MTGSAAPAPALASHRDGLPRTARAIAAVAWSCAAAALVIQALSGVDLRIGDLMFIVVDAVVAAVYGTVGALILARRRHVVGWLVSLAGIGAGLAALGGAWRNLTTSYPGLPEWSPLQSAYGSAWIPGTLGLFVLVPWFVRDHPMTRGAWWGVAGGIASILVMLAAPGGDPRLGIVLVVLMGLVTAAATWVRHRRGPQSERRGLGLLALGCAIMALSFVPLLFTWAHPDVVIALPLTHLACQALYPAALLVTVLRNRMWGLDLAVSRATVAALLTLGLVLVYAGIVLASTALVGNRLAAQVLAAVAVVVAVQPLRSSLQERVNRLVYGEGASPGRAALLLGRELSGASSADDLLDGLVSGVGQSLRLGSVTLTGIDRQSVLAQWGTPTSEAVQVPVLRAGMHIGDLTATPRDGERLDARTRDTLAQLADVVAAGIALAHGARDLERARDAVTRARLEERRTIRRELHDGLGPWLSGLRLGLQGARNTLATDPAAAAQVLQALQVETERRVEDVRVLSRSLLPPVLDELGLAAALEDLVQRQAAAGFAVALRCDRTDGLDARIAAAAYAIASEAVINAARHSGARACELRVTVGCEQLVVECDDAGTGLGPGATLGVGLRSMRERAEEQGGTLQVAPRAHGTRVRAVLPVLLTAASPLRSIDAEPRRAPEVELR